jgi:hypothetical protein
MKQVVVIFHLREGSELEAARLAAADPPFDPEEAGFKRLARLPWAATRCGRPPPCAGLRFESGRGLCKSPGKRSFSVQNNLPGVESAVGMEP